MRAFVETLNIETGQIDTVLDTDLHVEAPNWLPDGSGLIVNAAGRHYRLDFDDPRLKLIDTGHCIKGNNDHGPSPDGKTLMICDHGGGQGSIIHRLPVTGGTPQQVTPTPPSWFHGWSPDGARITYTCVRDGQFGIATCPAMGGEETVLIASDHHYDGPDYTPDGKYIWFNSDRGGDMALWRMRSDGSDPQQMTFDATVDWFPHPSPNGAHVCYLAYPPDTDGHPFGRDITLRLMPASGGPSRSLAQFFGGQGTLNVPSWAPDSTRFAYVRYAQTT